MSIQHILLSLLAVGLLHLASSVAFVVQFSPFQTGLPGVFFLVYLVTITVGCLFSLLGFYGRFFYTRRRTPVRFLRNATRQGIIVGFGTGMFLLFSAFSVLNLGVVVLLLVALGCFELFLRGA